MNRFLLLILLFSFFVFSSDANDEIVLNCPGQQHDHFEHLVPADQPSVYYNSVEQEIIIDGGGEVTYYDVEIASATTWTVFISTQVNGTYDTINVSSLPEGEYCITICSPTGNTFEGFFEVN